MKDIKIVREEALQFIHENEIALAGASRDPKKFGNIVFKTLKAKGVHIYPVNPNAQTLDGDTCYRTIAELPPQVKNLVVLLKPSETEKVIEEAIENGITKIWIQQGSESPAAIKTATNAGISLITGRCILMYAKPTGFHKFHRQLSKLFGQY